MVAAAAVAFVLAAWRGFGLKTAWFLMVAVFVAVAVPLEREGWRRDQARLLARRKDRRARGVAVPDFGRPRRTRTRPTLRRRLRSRMLRSSWSSILIVGAVITIFLLGLIPACTGYLR